MNHYWCIIGLFVLAFTMLTGLSPCGADTIYDYTYNEHLWATTIDTNSNEDIEYVVTMPGRTDFNLYVWDTCSEKWYYSQADGNTDWLVVPQHIGYQHYLYIYAYKGEGKWVLSCDSITWIPGSIEDLGAYTPKEIEDFLNSYPSP